MDRRILIISIVGALFIASNYSVIAQEEEHGYARPDYTEERNVAPGGEAFGSAGEPVPTTIDGDFTTSWNEKQEECSLTVKLKEETWIEGIWWTREYQPDGSIHDSNEEPRDYVIEVSEDSGKWETIADINKLKTVVTVEGNTEHERFHSFSPVLAKYVRIKISKTAPWGHDGARIGEFEIYRTASGEDVKSCGKLATRWAGVKADQ